MLPIYLKDRDFTPPADTIYYLLSRDGLFLVKRTPFFEAVVPATGIPWLESQEAEVLSHRPSPARGPSPPGRGLFPGGLYPLRQRSRGPADLAGGHPDL